MLDKYDHFKKVSKTEQCSLYDSQDRITIKSVLLKRLQQKSTWDDLLINSNLLFMNKAKFAPKMIQIFRKKGYYFIVYEKPTGPSLIEIQQIGKLPLNQFYPLFHDLCTFFIQLQRHNQKAYVRPEWIFINRNSCKICHFQPFFTNTQNDNTQHVFMYNLEKSINQNLNTNSTIPLQILTYPKKPTLTFTIGLIAYQLLTGTNPLPTQPQQPKEPHLTQLLTKAYGTLLKLTNDSKFSTLITKLLKQDPLDCPTLTQIYNISNNKYSQSKSPYNKTTIIQYDLQKIQLIDKYQQIFINNKKFTRPCCKSIVNEQNDFEIQKKGNLTMIYPKKQKNQKFFSSLKKQQVLPEINSPKSKDISKTTLSKPTMLKSQVKLRFDYL